jgi:hypothetical protein
VVVLRDLRVGAAVDVGGTSGTIRVGDPVEMDEVVSRRETP